jgi:hypothetical protein
VEGSPDSIAVPIIWSGPEDVPILFTNAFVSQFDQTLDAFILTFGQMTPPALVGATEEELRRQAEQITFISVKPIVRLSLTPTRLREVIASLQANLEQLEHVSTMQPGDPRDDRHNTDA